MTRKRSISPQKTCKNNSHHPFSPGAWISRKVWKDNTSVCAINFQMNSYLTEDNILVKFLEHSLQPRSLTRSTSTHLTQVMRMQQLPSRITQPPALPFISALMGLHQVTTRNSGNDRTSRTQGLPPLYLLQINHQPWYQRNQLQPFQNGCISPLLNLPLLIQKLQQWMRKVNTESWQIRCHLPEGSVWQCKYWCRYASF